MDAKPTSPWIARLLVGVMIAGAGGHLAGCSHGQARGKNAAAPTRAGLPTQGGAAMPSTGLEALAREGNAPVSASDVDEAARNLSQALRDGTAAGGRAPGGTRQDELRNGESAQRPPSSAMPTPEGMVGVSGSSEPPASQLGGNPHTSSGVSQPATSDAVAAEYVPSPAAASEPAGPQDPLLAAAQTMAALLRRTSEGGVRAISDVAALSPVEQLSPGATAALAAGGNAVPGTLRGLNDSDRQELIRARERLLAEPAAVPKELLASLRGEGAGTSLRIPRAHLASRVEGYGRFTPLPTTLVAGRTARMIVYTEVAGFASRPARDGDPQVLPRLALSEQVSVDLTQSLSLFHDPDGLLAWHRPAQAVIETSRNTRSDFYVIQIIELPSTLSVGRYNLKVTIVDRTSGAQAERVLPIEVVADPTLVRGE